MSTSTRKILLFSIFLKKMCFPCFFLFFPFFPFSAHLTAVNSSGESGPRWSKIIRNISYFASRQQEKWLTYSVFISITFPLSKLLFFFFWCYFQEISYFPYFYNFFYFLKFLKISDKNQFSKKKFFLAKNKKKIPNHFSFSPESPYSSEFLWFFIPWKINTIVEMMAPPSADFFKIINFSFFDLLFRCSMNWILREFSAWISYKFEFFSEVSSNSVESVQTPSTPDLTTICRKRLSLVFLTNSIIFSKFLRFRTLPEKLKNWKTGKSNFSRNCRQIWCKWLTVGVLTIFSKFLIEF